MVTITDTTREKLKEIFAKSMELDRREIGCSDCSIGLSAQTNYCPWCGKMLKPIKEQEHDNR